MPTGKNIVAATLAVLALIGFLIAFIALGWSKVPTENEKYLMISLTALINCVTTAFGYFLGSSFGSTQKNQLLSQAVNPGEVPPFLKSESGFADFALLIGMCLLCLALAGCAGTTRPTSDETVTQAMATAKQVHAVSGAIIANGGPFVVAGICIAQPQDCGAAKLALTLAQGTHNEITNLLVAAETAHAAPDGAKLSSLATSFAGEVDNINRLVASYGGKTVDLAEFRSTLAALQAPAPL